MPSCGVQPLQRVRRPSFLPGLVDCLGGLFPLVCRRSRCLTLHCCFTGPECRRPYHIKLCCAEVGPTTDRWLQWGMSDRGTNEWAGHIGTSRQAETDCASVAPVLICSLRFGDASARGFECNARLSAKYWKMYKDLEVQQSKFVGRAC